MGNALALTNSCKQQQQEPVSPSSCGLLLHFDIWGIGAPGAQDSEAEALKHCFTLEKQPERISFDHLPFHLSHYLLHKPENLGQLVAVRIPSYQFPAW